MSTDSTLVETLFRAAIDAGLASPERRALLLARLPAALVADLPSHSRPADQIRSDLDALVALGPGTGHAALRVWIGNAAAICGDRPQRSIFRAVGDRLGVSDGHAERLYLTLSAWEFSDWLPWRPTRRVDVIVEEALDTFGLPRAIPTGPSLRLAWRVTYHLRRDDVRLPPDRTLDELGVGAGSDLGLAAEVHVPGHEPTLLRSGSSTSDAEAAVGEAIRRAVERRRASYRPR
ncbi:MAG: hypothetical protein R3F65_23565 [bacterium]